MVFRRRTPRTWLQFIAEGFWPRGGWTRATRYVAHRLRRLPDPAHKISRGIAAGVFITFTPFFGLHFILSAILAYVLRGNIIAALLATFVGNPLTFPIIATIAMEIGSTILGTPNLPFSAVFGALSDAGVELWNNTKSLFAPEDANWGRFLFVMKAVIVPYLVGGLVPGLIAATAAYFLSHPVIVAYQKNRIKRQKARYDKRKAKEAVRAAKASSPDPAE